MSGAYSSGAPAFDPDAGGTATRRLLERLQSVAAEIELDLASLATLVATELACEVCSIYLARPDGRLELAATEGLSPDAVGLTCFGPGEGIVGRVAATGETINVADASADPGYVFRAETGEGAVASMLALPIRRAGRTYGVLCLQSARRETFPAADLEALSMAALVLGEVLAARAEPGPGPIAERPRHFRGVQLAPGIVRGRIVLSTGYRKPASVAVIDPGAEMARLERAVERMNADLELLLAGQAPEDGTADGLAARGVLDTTRLLVGASGWLRRVRTAMEEGLAAEAAVHRVVVDLRARMRDIADPLLREKLADLEDTAFALLAALDENRTGEHDPLPPGTILLARRLGPAKLLHWQARGIAGLVVEEATPAGHAAILARSMGIPAIGGIAGAREAAEDGTDAILDAEEGRLLLRPAPQVLRHYARALDRLEAQRSVWSGLRHAPDRTRDGRPFMLMLNAGLPHELAELDRLGAPGIGLFRTEIFALARGEIPNETDQEAFYRRALDGAGDRQILFRTLDLGADKLLPGRPASDEENPAMGWRSIRVGLDHPALLRRQLSAMLNAAAGRKLCVMFPMIADMSEFGRARALLDEELAAVAAPPSSLSVGAMLEVPSLLLTLPALFAAADLVSVGSNDLLQFLFAADRGTARIASRYDLFLPASLLAIEKIVATARAAGKPVSLCGEIAARPLEALTLAALGMTTLSMSPAGLLRVKAALVSVDLGAFATRLSALRDSGLTGPALRAALAAYAAENGIVL